MVKVDNQPKEVKVNDHPIGLRTNPVASRSNKLPGGQRTPNGLKGKDEGLEHPTGGGPRRVPSQGSKDQKGGVKANDHRGF